MKSNQKADSRFTIQFIEIYIIVIINLEWKVQIIATHQTNKHTHKQTCAHTHPHTHLELITTIACTENNGLGRKTTQHNVVHSQSC